MYLLKHPAYSCTGLLLAPSMFVSLRESRSARKAAIQFPLTQHH